jgi:hypothetical protein
MIRVCFIIAPSTFPPATIMIKNLLCMALIAAAGAATAQEQVVNLYSARHYSTDERSVQQLHQGHRHQDQPRGRR